MKNLLNCPFIPVTDRLASHRGAQGVIYGDEIREKYGNCDVNYCGQIKDHNQYDALWVYHGSDFIGRPNVYGGVYNFPYVENTVNFSKFKGQVYSIGIDFPEYHTMLQKKFDSANERGKAIQPEWHQVDLVNLKRMYDTAIRVDNINPSRKIVIGDSHSICMYRPGWTVNSVPFKTLNGALKEGFDKFIPHEYEFNDYIEKEYGIIRWTNYLLNKDKELDFKYMEKPRSIHLSREYYPYWTGIEQTINLEEFF